MLRVIETAKSQLLLKHTRSDVINYLVFDEWIFWGGFFPELSWTIIVIYTSVGPVEQGI